MADYTITLSEALEKGLDLYISVYPGRNEEGFAEKTTEVKRQEAFEFLISSHLTQLLRSRLDTQNREKSIEQVAAAVEL